MLLNCLLLSVAVAVSQALPSNTYSYQHRSMPNPVYKQQNFWTVPFAPTIGQGEQYHATIIVDNGGFCGGILVDVDKVLTSAQCVLGGTTFEIRLNRRDLYNANPDENANEVVVSSTKFTIHPYFYSDYMRALNDLALLALDSPVSIAPVLIGGTYVSDPLTQGIDLPLVGFGLSNDPQRMGHGMQGYLQWVSTHSKPIAECKGLNFGVDTQGQHVCVEASGPSACFGDPGAPLLQWNQERETHGVIGIASFGSSTPCDLYGPTIFTYLPPYYAWLERNGVPIAV